MGIDYHLFNFLRWQSRIAPLGNVLTIGRMSLDVPVDVVKQELSTSFESTGYSEPLLSLLGASSVSSIDASSYESPTFLGDFNQPISHPARYETVIDGGSLEHVFDVAQAFRNVNNLCAVGGRIIHVLPVNNLNGHGFWQFCSDLLYSIYSQANGYTDTQVFYASTLDYDSWYLAPVPVNGKRVEIVSVEPIILLSVSTKHQDVCFQSPVQPYYLQAWVSPSMQPSSSPKVSAASVIKKVVKSNRKFFSPLRNTFLLGGLISGFSSYSVRSTHFSRVRVSDLLRVLRK